MVAGAFVSCFALSPLKCRTDDMVLPLQESFSGSLYIKLSGSLVKLCRHGETYCAVICYLLISCMHCCSFCSMCVIPEGSEMVWCNCKVSAKLPVESLMAIKGG